MWYRWDAVWELELVLPITTLRFSTIGDFFIATGFEIFNIWRKDRSTPFFSSEVFFAVDKQLAIPSRKTEFLTPDKLGDIIQCEVSIEGRLIITLERAKKTLKIWYNDYDIVEEVAVDVGNGDTKKSSRPTVSPYQVIKVFKCFSPWGMTLIAQTINR